MRETWLFSDSQDMNGGGNNLDSTGVISDNIWDLEYDNSDVLIVTDLMVEGCINILFTAVGAYTNGTEGLIISLRTDDATDLATSIDGSSAGYCDVAMKHILLEDIVAGRVFSIPFHLDKAVYGRYLGVWYRAHTTTITTGANITVDAWFAEYPISRGMMQKRPT